MTYGMSALLHADPAFAAGAGSFSSGLERLAGDGWVTTPAQLTASMLEVIRYRWSPFDRPFLVRGFGAGESELTLLDLDIEASMPGAEARAASRRAGTALLGMWARLGLASAGNYREVVRSGDALGHLPVAQGIIFAARGLSCDEAQALSCWAVLSSFAASAVRLGLVGHQSAQEALLTAVEDSRQLLSEPVATDAIPWTCTPVQDIAVERHALSNLKLFAS